MKEVIPIRLTGLKTLPAVIAFNTNHIELLIQTITEGGKLQFSAVKG
jgi:hypothetical protein